MSRRNTLQDLSHDVVVYGIAGLALTILIAPVIIVLLTSFTDSQTLKFPPTGFSLQWYEMLFDPAQSRQIHRSAYNTLEVAMWATGGAALLGTLAALGLYRSHSRGARFADTLFMSPLILPGISFGLAALIYFTFLGFRPSLTLMTIGHAIMIVPFVLRTSMASLTQLDGSLLDAAHSLGASRFYSFRRVTFPIILPGVAAGSFIAFMASVDNVPVSLFLSGPRTDMLPIRLWGMMESTLDVRVAAVSGVLIISILIALLIMERLTGLSQRMRG